jgi:hypothetical protein
MPTKSASKKPAKAVTHPWDICAQQRLTRTNGAFGHEEPLDPGVNFFVLALEALGAKPKFSCEGHPTGFYVAFNADYALAQEISGAGYFSVEISGENYWAMRTRETPMDDEEYCDAHRVRKLRWATEAWIRVFGSRLGNLATLG